jgi:hypothetical protein
MQLIRGHHQTVIHTKFLILQELFFLTHISIQLLSWHQIINIYNPTKSLAFHSHFQKNRNLNKIHIFFSRISFRFPENANTDPYLLFRKKQHFISILQDLKSSTIFTLSAEHNFLWISRKQKSTTLFISFSWSEISSGFCWD